MYKIIKNTTCINMVEQVIFVQLSPEGFYLECSAEDAYGFLCAGKAFHLEGRPKLKGNEETVLLLEVDAGKEIKTAIETNEILFVTLAEAGSIDGTTAGEHADMFAPWAVPVNYQPGNIRRYGGKLYRCLQAHISQESWTPDAAPSLWVAIADPMEQFPAWNQPIGAMDAYPKGAQVSHKDRHWISDVDNNVWEPGIYGWTEQQE